jgi:homocitrate synthase
VVFGTSSELRDFSHGKSIQYIIEAATEVINYVKSKGVEVRFSSEVCGTRDVARALRVNRDRLIPIA